MQVDGKRSKVHFLEKIYGMHFSSFGFKTWDNQFGIHMKRLSKDQNLLLTTVSSLFFFFSFYWFAICDITDKLLFTRCWCSTYNQRSSLFHRSAETVHGYSHMFRRTGHRLGNVGGLLSEVTLILTSHSQYFVAKCSLLSNDRSKWRQVSFDARYSRNDV